eukprot:12938098-Prorocentrum_lima.AAC.1
MRSLVFWGDNSTWLAAKRLRHKEAGNIAWACAGTYAMGLGVIVCCEVKEEEEGMRSKRWHVAVT